MHHKKNVCPLCSAAAETSNNLVRDTLFCCCTACGQFGITLEAALELRSIHEEVYKLSSFTREQTLREHVVLLTSTDIVLKNTDRSDPLYDATPISIQEILETRFPTGIDGILDRSLHNLSLQSDQLGAKVRIDPKVDCCLLFVRSANECDYVLDALAERGDVVAFGTSAPTSEERFARLTPGGWGRVAGFRTGEDAKNNVQVFVAMWFGSGDKKFRDEESTVFCNRAYLDGFVPGIKGPGYAPSRIDSKEYNDDVTDEIIVEIRRSRFMVADFTGNRGGVYYEAGFAKGLGKTVIFTCHEHDVGGLHFDTNHMNHIVWSSPEELATKLERRIAATIGLGSATTPSP